MVSIDNIVFLLVGVGCSFLLLATFPEIITGGVVQQKDAASCPPTDIDSVLTGIQTINLVLDDSDEIEIKGLEVDRFDLLGGGDGPSAGGGGVADHVTLHLSSSDALQQLQGRSSSSDDEDEDAADIMSLSAHDDGEEEASPEPEKPIKKRQYYMPVQNAAKRSNRKEQGSSTNRRLRKQPRDSRDLGVKKWAKKTAKKAGKAVSKTTSSATKTVSKTASTAAKATSSAAKSATKAVVGAGKDAADALKKIGDLPGLIQKKIINPVVDDIEDAFDDLAEIDEIAEKVAQGAVNVIKNINLFPLVSELAKKLEAGMKAFLNKDFCVPYKCIIKKLGDIDISNIELYSSENVKITTAITPETCMSVTEIKFDTTKLQKFMNIFKNIDLKEIYDKVKKWLQDQMDDIIDFADDITDLLGDVEDIVEDAVSLLGLRRRRLVVATNTTEGNTTQPTSVQEMSAMAYEKGLGYFKELYGTEVKRVYAEHERHLLKSPGRYIGFKSFKVKVSQNFEQTLTLEASKRTGYADSIFDEAMHQDKRIPIPGTAGMVNVLVSGSLEGSLPYHLSMDAEAKATFGYNMGAFGAEVNLVNGKIDFFKKDFKPIVDVSAKVGVSGGTSLNFAASASLGICLGPDDDACLIVTLDANQKAGVGFDAIAGLNLESTALVPMYADGLEYKNKKTCDKQLGLSAGYWMYVKEPHVTLAISGNTCCDEFSATLFDIGGGYLFKHTNQFCIDTNVM